MSDLLASLLLMLSLLLLYNLDWLYVFHKISRINVLNILNKIYLCLNKYNHITKLIIALSMYNKHVLAQRIKWSYIYNTK